MAWRELIERINPDLFVTITFRTTTSKRAAEKYLKKFFKFLNKDGEIFYNKFILAWVVVFERPVEGDGYHIHALIRDINPSLALPLEKKLNERFGSSKVLVYDHNWFNYPASDYLAEKYIKYGYEGLELFRINSRFRNKSTVG